MGKISRRKFLATGGAMVFFGRALGSRPVHAATRTVSPNEKLNIAGIGAGGKGEADLSGCASENIVALCDVDDERAAKMYQRFDKAAKYKDFRVMLEKERDNIDAVTISTPDHVHAPAARVAMELGKHVYVQKPLTHTIAEARRLTELARQYKVATQMGNQGHSGPGVRVLCEWVWDGAIGPVKEAHVWTNRPIWPQGLERPTDTPPVPATLDWDLWLGPAPERPYNPAYCPFAWRGWWDFGCGALGDMACHIMDPANWALKLGETKGIIKVEAESSGVNSESAPNWAIIRYEFPARGDLPPVKLTWYDGGKLPPRPDCIDPDAKIGDGDNGSLLVGEKGMVAAGTYGDGVRLFPDTLMKSYKRPEHTIPKVSGPYKNWIEACKGGEPACSNFDYAGPFTEIVLLGNLALRTGKPLEWDPVQMKVVNYDEANQFVGKTYRKGWEVL